VTGAVKTDTAIQRNYGTGKDVDNKKTREGRAKLDRCISEKVAL